MLRQVGLLREGLAAEGARVGPLGGVALHVASHVPGGGARLSAQAAEGDRLGPAVGGAPEPHVRPGAPQTDGLVHGTGKRGDKIDGF